MLFRTTEWSDPRFETDNLRFCTVKSKALQARADVCLFVPPGLPAGNYPVVVLLHGVYGSAWCWALKAGVHKTAGQLIRSRQLPPFLIAMPSDGLWGDGSAYLPHHGKNFEHWIADEVPALVADIGGGIKGSKYFISGLSMGGFGALRIGAKYHKTFAALGAHSAITSLPQMTLFVEENIEDYAQRHIADEDVFSTMLQHQHHLPPIYFDCGKADQLIEHNRLLHRQMQTAGIMHTYNEFEGGHEWKYWEAHITETLLFFGRFM